MHLFVGLFISGLHSVGARTRGFCSSPSRRWRTLISERSKCHRCGCGCQGWLGNLPWSTVCSASHDIYFVCVCTWVLGIFVGMLACMGGKTHEILLLPPLLVYLAYRTRPGTETLNRLWLDGWMEGQMDGRTDGQMEWMVGEWMKWRMDGSMDWLMEWILDRWWRVGWLERLLVGDWRERRVVGWKSGIWVT